MRPNDSSYHRPVIFKTHQKGQRKFQLRTFKINLSFRSIIQIIQLKLLKKSFHCRFCTWRIWFLASCPPRYDFNTSLRPFSLNSRACHCQCSRFSDDFRSSWRWYSNGSSSKTKPDDQSSSPSPSWSVEPSLLLLMILLLTWQLIASFFWMTFSLLRMECIRKRNWMERTWENMDWCTTIPCAGY